MSKALRQSVQKCLGIRSVPFGHALEYDNSFLCAPLSCRFSSTSEEYERMQTPHAYEGLALSPEILVLALNHHAAAARLPDVPAEGSVFFVMPGLPARNF